MNNKEKENGIESKDFDRDRNSNDYLFLVQKLKDIKKTINILEKNFLDKEI